MNGGIRIRFYAGPTISEQEVRSLCADCDARVEVCPPVEQGDLLRDLPRLPEYIGIIDGYFYQVPAVLHKEILLAINVSQVFGASSMGALRAAELDRFGMVGIGRIYRMYADGAIDGDDEVAVQHGPEQTGYYTLTVPLVNVRETLYRARAADVIDESIVRCVMQAARDIHFTERTWSEVLAHPALEHLDAARQADLSRYVEQSPADLKHEDAVLLVRHICSRVRSGSGAAGQQVSVSRTKYLHFHERDYICSSDHGSRQVADTRVLSFNKLLAPDFAEVVSRCATRLAVADEAQARGVAPDSDEVLLTDYWRAGSLESMADRSASLGAMAIRESDLLTRLRRVSQAERLVDRISATDSVTDRADIEDRLVEAVCERLGIARSVLHEAVFVRQFGPWEEELIMELKLTGRFTDAVVRATEILDRFDLRFADSPMHWFVMQSLNEFSVGRIRRWAAQLWGVGLSELAAEMRSRAFHSADEFLETARIACLCDEDALSNSTAKP